jgi:hypothetical protein
LPPPAPRTAKAIDQAVEELSAIAGESARLAEEQLEEVRKVMEVFRAVSAGSRHIAEKTDSAGTKTNMALNEI